jgi:hypothetical protein
MMNNVDQIVSRVLDGLTTDGGHHKQHYLEDALKLLVGESRFFQLKNELGWEDGRPD